VTLVVTLGRVLDPAQFGPQPGNVHLAGYISQAFLLPRCAVVVSHGGFSTVLGALASGVPMVILPGGADQPVTARRAAAMGTAVILEQDQRTPADIRAAVRMVLADTRYRQRAQEVQAEIANLPGPE
jgi:MGT family glycosyltransferase